MGDVENKTPTPGDMQSVPEFTGPQASMPSPYPHTIQGVNLHVQGGGIPPDLVQKLDAEAIQKSLEVADKQDERLYQFHSERVRNEHRRYLATLITGSIFMLVTVGMLVFIILKCIDSNHWDLIGNLIWGAGGLFAGGAAMLGVKKLKG